MAALIHNPLVAFWMIGLGAFLAAAEAQVTGTLPGTVPYVDEVDLPDRMLAGINRFLREQTQLSKEARAVHWNRDHSSVQAYEISVAPNRERLRRMIGVVDQRLPIFALDYVASTVFPARIAEAGNYTVYRIRWPVLEGVYGEGLLLQPRGNPTARVIALPDADQSPEMLIGLTPGVNADSQFARRLAEAGCQVVVPVLIDRADTFSGNPALERFTNQPHREWIYRQAYQMGRHVIGYEVQKILSLVDWFLQDSTASGDPGQGRIGVAGYGEGGLLALYSAAVDTRIDATLVSGYFASRQDLWEEPIYRNIFGLLDEFGDAEIASLVVPRRLFIEPSDPPAVDGPPAPRAGRRGGAPGRIPRPSVEQIQAEVVRAQKLVGPGFSGAVVGISLETGEPGAFGSPQSVHQFLNALEVSSFPSDVVAKPRALVDDFGLEERQRRQVRELEEFTQKQIILAETDRAGFFWNELEGRVRESEDDPLETWGGATRKFKDYFWDEVIGRLPSASVPPNARTRLVRDEPTWKGYLVVLDVWPDVISWGYLLVPKDLKPGERRPAVVCQHGITGTPESTLDPESRAYKGYAVQLVEQGFVVFSAYNPNAARGHNRFLDLQRLANPIKKSIFSVILGQHDRILDFLSAQPFIDPERIGFYGLSYGGKTAMRVPALLDRYALSICSGDFNEWIRKTITVHAVTNAAAPAYRFSGYMFTGEYEIFEFDLGRTFNYAEMAALIAPRPFMVERGHFDRVGTDEWIAYEYAKVFRLYNATLKIPERTAIEVFDGGHEIHGQMSFEFLRKHLQWPEAHP